jgi:hypothetical protein
MSSNTSATQNADRLLIAGITKHLSNVTQVMADGVGYTPSQLNALLQQEITAADLVASNRAAWLAAVLSKRTVTITLASVKSALHTTVVNMFGKSSPVLADFGYAKQAQKPSPATQVVAVDKRLATRTARKTVGKRQKQQIKGSPAIAATAATATAAPGNPPKA